MCNIAGQAVSCTRGEALNVGASYPVITLTVDVAPAAPPSLTNVATVSGGGEINTANSTASDVTTIGPGPDLTITKNHPGNFTQGQTGNVHHHGQQPGAASTIGLVDGNRQRSGGTVDDDRKRVAAGPATSWPIATCTRSDPLATGQSHPITLTVNVTGAPGRSRT